METVEHFARGWWTPAAAYAISFLGSLLGLSATTQARRLMGSARLGWLVLGALIIGSTGIWAMHFIAMTGFAVPGAVIRYDVPLTLASGILAVAVVGVGLSMAIRWPGWGGLLTGGLITGSGVSGMHYLGMASMQLNGHLEHDPVYVAAAVLIALAAATFALFFALRVRGVPATLGAALLMGAAVSSMHYMGMLGVSAHVYEGAAEVPEGASGLDFFLPLFGGLGVLLMVGTLSLLLAPSEDEARSDHQARQWLAGRHSDSPAAPPPETADPERSTGSGPRPSRSTALFTPRNRR